MGTPRRRRDCIAAVLRNNQLMVVGGYITDNQLMEVVGAGYISEAITTDSVEFAAIE